MPNGFHFTPITSVGTSADDDVAWEQFMAGVEANDSDAAGADDGFFDGLFGVIGDITAGIGQVAGALGTTVQQISGALDPTGPGAAGPAQGTQATLGRQPGARPAMPMGIGVLVLGAVVLFLLLR